MKAEIDCVAVTDHNSGAWIDKLKEELNVMESEECDGFRPLTIFPGVEISVSGGIHLLAIFDPSVTGEDISNLLGAVQYEGNRGETDGCTRKSFTEVVEEIIRNYGIAIPAHVDDESGLFKVFQGITLKTSLMSNGLLAIQICNPLEEKPQIYKDMKLNFAEVAGSDSHHPNCVGQSYAWVKMEKPDITALRLALHDGEDGILRYDTYSGNPNEVGTRFFIQNISITDGAKAGRGTPLKVTFSPWLTTLIGGRGSGKSSVVEYLRLGLDNRDSLPESLKKEFDDFAQITSGRGKTGMLTKNTVIRVELKKDGRDVALVWKDNQIIEEQKDDSGRWITKEKSNIVQKRFPIRMFSQKQLFEMTKDPHVVLNLIDRQFDKSTWQERRDELEKQWLESRRLEREYHEKLSGLPDIKAELDDVPD
ncbi:AAA family ATPase [Effusibacillus consociatus]|uniref:AAA family ATPase n=1 Tax=Effusibacillus consociatus TaxID=1117041 RepID=UPI003A8F9401